MATKVWCIEWTSQDPRYADGPYRFNSKDCEFQDRAPAELLAERLNGSNPGNTYSAVLITKP